MPGTHPGLDDGANLFAKIFKIADTAAPSILAIIYFESVSLPKNPADQIEHELLLLKQKNDLQKLAVLSINYGLCMFQTN